MLCKNCEKDIEVAGTRGKWIHITTSRAECLASTQAEPLLANDDLSVQIAEILHARQCHSNHTDACGWHYESWNNPGHARTRWLKKAEKTIEEYPDITIEEVERVLRVFG